MGISETDDVVSGAGGSGGSADRVRVARRGDGAWFRVVNQRDFPSRVTCWIWHACPAIGIALIPFVDIPRASFEYLGTLVNCQSVKALLFFRAELLTYGWDLLQQHPLLGVGIQGFRYYSPNAGLYNWPHNIFLEVSCEMGLPAGFLVMALFGSAVREAWRQLHDRTVALFGAIADRRGAAGVGIVNATNTGDINSDRSTWFFLSLVFVMRGLRNAAYPAVHPATPTVPGDRRSSRGRATRRIIRDESHAPWPAPQPTEKQIPHPLAQVRDATGYVLARSVLSTRTNLWRHEQRKSHPRRLLPFVLRLQRAKWPDARFCATARRCIRS